MRFDFPAPGRRNLVDGPEEVTPKSAFENNHMMILFGGILGPFAFLMGLFTFVITIHQRHSSDEVLQVCGREALYIAEILIVWSVICTIILAILFVFAMGILAIL